MAGKPRYTKALIEALYKLYDGNFVKMARSINAPEGSIGVACKRYGLKNRRVKNNRRLHHRPKTTEYIRTVQLLPTMNNSMISREVNLSKERIRQIRDEHGIPSPLKNKSCSPSWTEEKIAKLSSLNPEEYTIKEVSEILGLSITIVRKKANEFGIGLFKYIPKIKYTEEFIRALYVKCNGNLSKMAKEVGVHSPSMARQCYKYSLRGRGCFEKKNHYRSKKYSQDKKVKRLWKRYNGVMYQIAQNSDIPLGSISNICQRLGLTK